MDRTLWKKAPLVAAALLATVCEAPGIFWGGPGAGVAAAYAAGQQQKEATAPAGKQTGKSQSALAAKTVFATIAASDPAVARTAPAVDLSAVRKLIGKEGAIQGTVAKAYVSDGNGIVILNFAKNFREAATAVLKPANYSKFPDLQTLTNKRVVVSGRVREFRGRPEIELTDPGQIKIVK